VRIASGAKAPNLFIGVMYGVKPVPFYQSGFVARLKPRPFKARFRRTVCLFVVVEAFEAEEIRALAQLFFNAQ